MKPAEEAELVNFATVLSLMFDILLSLLTVHVFMINGEFAV